MPTTAEALELAFRHHQAGQLREAEALYTQVLAAEPNHADALHLLGLVAYQTSRYQTAVELISRAIALGGAQAVFQANLGEAYRALGKLSDAEAHLRQALRLDPTLADAHNSLGNVLRSRGQSAEAVAEFQRAIALRPVFAEAHNNLGAMLQAQGDLPAAIAQYRRATELNPNYAGAYNNLGIALMARGDLAEACTAFEQALRLDPNNAEVHLHLGTAYQQQQKAEQAIACYQESLRLNPRNAQALNNLGSALIMLERIDEAIAACRQALQLTPNLADAHFNLGVALHTRHQWPATEAEYREAVGIDPKYVKALANLAVVMEHLGRLDEGLAWCERAVAVQPDFADAHLNRANLCRLKRMVPEAVASYRRALDLRPDFPEAYNGLAVLYLSVNRIEEAIENCRKGIERTARPAALYANMSIAMQHLGRVDEAIAFARKSVASNPGDTAAHSNLLYQLNYHPAYGAAAIFAEHLNWASLHAEPLAALAVAHRNDHTLDRRLRVGYVSPYFRDHAVNFFFEPILATHDHNAFEVFCYSDVAQEDGATARLREAADHWRPTRYVSDEQLAQTVRDDAIDILVDLTGHIGGSRLLAFARKPAPVQVTYLGYQNTTGMSAMDYRLTDSRADPPGMTDAFYTEKLVRLPRCFFCYKPPDEAPAVTPLPALTSGAITFGSFNNFSKVAPPVIDAWLEILSRVERSRLMILAHSGSQLRAHFDKLAAARGLEPTRIELVAKRPRAEYFQLISQVDIALDPFPFNGHTTTCDAIWMGVPVVMLEGETYASRFGGCVLANVGLESFIASSVSEYIEGAVDLAAEANRAELAGLRAELRPRMAASVLLDFEGFTRNLEAAYRTMWREWVEERRVDSR